MSSSSSTMDDGDMGFWNGFWDAETTPWHKKTAHPKLRKHLDLLTGGKERRRTFFFPLCGKTMDMRHMYEMGHRVVGTEGNEDGCRQFFQESGMDFQEVEGKGGFKIFTSTDGRLKIFCGNHFNITKDIIGETLECVFDRGSMIAIKPEYRERYVKVMKDLLKGHSFAYLLSSVIYELPDEVKKMKTRVGPPFPLDLDKIRDYFQDFCHMRVLEVPEAKVVVNGYHMVLPEQSGGENSKIGMITDKAPFKGNDLLVLLTPRGEEGENNRIDGWQNRYVDNTAHWHTGGVHWSLEKFYDTLKGDLAPSSRILLPLCGKAVDLTWLHAKGHEVVGVEGVNFVAESVFVDAGIPHTSTYLPEVDGYLIKSDDSRLSIYVCDFFSVGLSLLGGRHFDLVFDRGGFGAVDKKDREKYADLIHTLVSPRSRRMLLAVQDYDDSGDFQGPPLAVHRDQVDRAYGGERGRVELLETWDNPEKARRFGVDKIVEHIYLITDQ